MNLHVRLAPSACLCLMISLSPWATADQESSAADSENEYTIWSLQPPRTPQGKEIQLPEFKAKFIRISADGDKVTLEKEGGGGGTYPLSMLSPTSREQAKKLAAIADLKKKKEGDFIYEIRDDAVTIIACSGKNGDVAFPEKISGLPVTAIDIPHGMLQTAVVRVTIPSSVVSISAPFGSCKALSEISVDPANSAFRSVDGVLFDKKGTTLIQFPVGKTVKSYTIPNGVTTVGRSAFWPSPLSSVTIPSTVTNLQWAAFSGTGLTSVTIPSSVTHIEANVFSGCESLTSLTFEGNAPKVELPNFYKVPAGFAIYFYKGSKGFSKS